MEALHVLSHWIALALEFCAIAIIALGAIEAIVGIVRIFGRAGVSNDERREVWLMFARWLVAGMTFQLGADVVNTSFDPTWDELGRLAAIAAIRTLLSYFLDREVSETRERQYHGRRADEPAPRV